MLALFMRGLHQQLSLEEEMMSDSFKKKLDGDSGFLKWKSGKRTRRFDCAIFSVDEVERTNHDGRHGSS